METAEANGARNAATRQTRIWNSDGWLLKKKFQTPSLARANLMSEVQM
jgi:hypothetical protein